MAFTVSARVKSFAYAFGGLGFMLRTQHNAWLHAVATVAVVAMGLSLRIHGADWRWLIMAIAMVWVAETFNTAVEYVCDVVSPGYSEAVKHAKDIAAGAVLLCAFASVLIGLITLAPYVGWGGTCATRSSCAVRICREDWRTAAGVTGLTLESPRLARRDVT